MKTFFVLSVVLLAGCVALPTRVVYVPVPYVPYVPPQNGAVQQAPQTYISPVYPVYQTPMYPMYSPRNLWYCPGPWCPQQQFFGYGGNHFFFYHRGGRW